MIQSEILNEVTRAYRTAVSSINLDGQEPIFLDDQRNADIVRKYLLEQTGVPTGAWKSEFVWKAAILECRAQNLLVPLPIKPSRAEREAELHVRDAADGSSVGNAHSHYKPRAKATEEETAKAKQWYADLKDPVAANRRRAQEKETVQKAAEQEQRDLLAALPLDVDYQQMSKEQKAQFKRLNSDSVKYWLKRRAQWDAQNGPVDIEAA